MLRKIIFIFVFVGFNTLFAQNYIKHTVADGETIGQIAQKYKVTPYDIYKLNPDSQNGVTPNSVLLIPKSADKVVVKTEPKPVVTTPKPVTPTTTAPKPVEKPTQGTITHVVKTKETLYGILKMYNISQEELEKNNPFLKDSGLQIGQELTIRKNGSSPKPVAVSNNSKVITHEVLPKETKYGIATKYGLTVEELEAQNPEIKENLPIGYQLKINKSAVKTVTPKEVKTTEVPVEKKKTRKR